MEGTKKTAIVTGAAGLIGAGIVDHLQGRGWSVRGFDVAGPERVDVSDEASVTAAIEGTPALDLLVNCAGIADPVSGPLEDLDLADWRRWIDVNLTGAMLMTKHCIPALRAQSGAVVNITSTRAAMSEPGCEAYAASKGGLAALTHAMAVSLGPGIRVNAVAPGWITDEGVRPEDHAQHPAGRVGRAADVAEAVAWLADAGFVTGETVTVDGGMTRRMIYAE